MVSLTGIAHGIATYTSSFFTELSSAISVKLVIAFLGSILAYTIGVDSVSIFLALVVLVLLELLTHVVAQVHAATKDNDWMKCGHELERIFFSTAAQLVVYGVLTAASHLVDGIVLGQSSFLEDVIVSFLAVSELIRIFKASAELGYSMPPFLMEMLKSYTESNNN